MQPSGCCGPERHLRPMLSEESQQPVHSSRAGLPPGGVKFLPTSSSGTARHSRRTSVNELALTMWS